MPRYFSKMLLLMLTVLAGLQPVVVFAQLTSLTNEKVKFKVAKEHWVELKRGNISAIIVDNAAIDIPQLPNHRPGYSGIAKLTHKNQARNVFVPGIVGLNFEHIHDGTTEGLIEKFEPRKFPMELRVVDEFTVELYQPPTKNWGLESCGRYHLLPDGTVEYSFECIPRQLKYKGNFVGLFWASYINSPAEKAIHFSGIKRSSPHRSEWIKGVTPKHGVRSTHSPIGNELPPIDEDFPLTLVNHPSEYQYDKPWYYGICRGMALVQMFRSQDHVWFAQSPSGGGSGNPAWDFQWFIDKPQKNKSYSLVMRMGYVPYKDLQQLQEYSNAHLNDLEPKSSIKTQVLQTEMVDLRSGKQREWTRFAKTGLEKQWTSRFTVEGVAIDPDEICTLLIRQADVRRNWEVILNDQKLGLLKKEQNDLVQTFRFPSSKLRRGENKLSITGVDSENSDDISIGPVIVAFAEPNEYLNQTRLSLKVKDLEHSESPLPCRFTILDSNGSLAALSVASNNRVAVREGVVYARDGQAEIGLSPGRYTIFANRGFEYSQAAKEIELKNGDSKKLELGINRVIDTRGWVACDTHVHTVTHSGHGDCQIEERMITLAGEGIELPIATDHNKQINYQPVAEKTRTRQFFTPVIGNEVTTDFGHFNSFPLPANQPVPNHKLNDWGVLLPDIYKLGAKVIILNHGRDIHRGYRPLDPLNFNEASGQPLNGRPFLFNAMEVINSAAQQTDQFELFRDWMAMVNGGHKVVPIGSSDSHDVNAFIVGQGRTYIQADDTDPGKIDIGLALENLAKGKITVSCGLMAKIRVNDKYGPGDLVNGGSGLKVECELTGPNWLAGNRIQLYENGVLIQDKTLESGEAARNTKGGSSKRVVFSLAKPRHDSFIVLLVRGPGHLHSSWNLAQPYQPTGPSWDPEIFGFTGAVYVDQDRNGKFDSARDYAQQLVQKHKTDLQRLVKALEDYDQAVAVQAADLFHGKHGDLLDSTHRDIWRAGSNSVRSGFTKFLEAWKKSERARVLE